MTKAFPQFFEYFTSMQTKTSEAIIESFKRQSENASANHSIQMLNAVNNMAKETLFPGLTQLMGARNLSRNMNNANNANTNQNQNPQQGGEQNTNQQIEQQQQSIPEQIYNGMIQNLDNGNDPNEIYEYVISKYKYEDVITVTKHSDVVKLMTEKGGNYLILIQKLQNYVG